MKRLNETNAIDALLGIIPAVVGCAYSKGESPDDFDSRNKEIDFILLPLSSNFPKLAVEHTIVEAYRGQRTYLNRSHKIVQRIDQVCRGHLPADRTYGLLLPPELVERLQRKEIDKFVQAISQWVMEKAMSLFEDGSDSARYNDFEVHLLCDGSYPENNGTVGCLPGVPKSHKELVVQSLWHSIEHATGKFAKYRAQGFSLVLVVENISGIAHPSTLVELAGEPHRKGLIDGIDFVIEFVSNEDRMIVGNVWKEGKILHSPVPYNRRFRKIDGTWTSYA